LETKKTTSTSELLKKESKFELSDDEEYVPKEEDKDE